MKLLKLLTFSAFALLSLNASAAINFPINLEGNYTGIEYKHSYVKQKINVSDLMPRNFPTATIYAGKRLFGEKGGAELGYSGNIKISRAAITKCRFHNFYVDLSAYRPLNDKFEVFGTVGVSLTKLKIKTKYDNNRAKVAPAAGVPGPLVGGIMVAPGPAAAVYPSQDSFEYLISKTEPILRAGIGANYMFNDYIGGRVKFLLEGTGRIRVLSNQTKAEYKPYKNLYSISGGVFYKF